MSDVGSNFFEEFSKRKEEEERDFAALPDVGFASMIKSLVFIQFQHQCHRLGRELKTRQKINEQKLIFQE